jgi:hypothetical protein
MVKKGRPLTEGERQDVVIHVRVTPELAGKVDRRRGLISRAEWVRDQIKKGLK